MARLVAFVLLSLIGRGGREGLIWPVAMYTGEYNLKITLPVVSASKDYFLTLRCNQ